MLHGAIGDVARSLSLLVRVRKAMPNAKICWGVEPPSLNLVQTHPAVDEVFLFDRPKGLKEYIRYIRALRREKFDIVFDLQRHIKSGFTAFATRAPIRIGFHRKNAKEGNWLFSTHWIPPSSKWTPKILQYHQCADVLGLPPLDPYEFGLGSEAGERHAFEALLIKNAPHGYNPGAPLVACLLGSTWVSRIWMPERCAAVADEAYRRWGMYSVLVGGGKRDEELARRVQAAAKTDSIINLTGKTVLRDLTPLFETVDVAYGPDSGPMHIAAAVGVPVISFWGPTSPKRSGPYRFAHLQLQSSVGCAPCYRRNCPGLEQACLREIPVEAIIGRIEQVLAERQPPGHVP